MLATRDKLRFQKICNIIILVTDQTNPRRIIPPQPREHWVGPDDPQLLLLRNWQVERLSGAYADLRASPRYGLACDFFLDDIYSPASFSNRHDDIDRIYRLAAAVLPAGMLKPIFTTVELYNLTEELDQTLLRALVDELGMTDTLTAELYTQGYRVCDNCADRACQIDLLMQAGASIEGLTRFPLVSTTIRVTRMPAKLTGWSEAHGFLERCLTAFKRTKGAKEFWQTVYRREMRILDRIFSGGPDPFAI